MCRFRMRFQTNSYSHSTAESPFRVEIRGIIQNLKANKGVFSDHYFTAIGGLFVGIVRIWYCIA